jgi:hypothetical protein
MKTLLSPQIITPTEQGVYLVPISVRPHGALLLGHMGFTRSFDRHIAKASIAHTGLVVAQLPHAWWHQSN